MENQQIPIVGGYERCLSELEAKISDIDSWMDLVKK